VDGKDQTDEQGNARFFGEPQENPKDQDYAAQVQYQVIEVVDKRGELSDLVIEGVRDHRQRHVHVLHRGREVVDQIAYVDLPDVFIENRFRVVKIDKGV